MIYITILDNKTGTTFIRMLPLDVNIEESENVEKYIEENFNIKSENMFYLIGDNINIQI